MNKASIEIKTSEPMRVSSIEEGSGSIKIDLELKPERKPIPSVELETFGPRINSRGQIQFRSLVKGSNGRLYAAGYYSQLLAEIWPKTGIISFDDLSSISRNRAKWVDGFSYGSKVVFYPNKANGYLVIDTETKQKTTVGSAYQIRSGAEGRRGVFWSPQYGSSGNDNIGIIRGFDADSGKPIVPIKYGINREGPLFQQRETWEEENQRFAGIYDRYWGACRADNGILVFPPFGSDRVLFLNPLNGFAWQGEDIVTGGVDSYTGPLDIFDSPYLYKYSGAVKSSVTGDVISAGRHALGWLVIDPKTEDVEEIPYDPEMLEGNEKLSKSFTVFEGPDKRIWTVPWQVPRIAWLDPETKETGSIDLSEQLEMTGTKRNFFTYAQVVNNEIILAPGASNYFAKLKFS